MFTRLERVMRFACRTQRLRSESRNRALVGGLFPSPATHHTPISIKLFTLISSATTMPKPVLVRGPSRHGPRVLPGSRPNHLNEPAPPGSVLDAVSFILTFAGLIVGGLTASILGVGRAAGFDYLPCRVPEKYWLLRRKDKHHYSRVRADRAYEKGLTADVWI